MWKDSIRNIVVIFQTNILRIVGFYVRRSAIVTSSISFGLHLYCVYKIPDWTRFERKTSICAVDSLINVPAKICKYSADL